MLADILAAFRAPAPDRLTNDDARLALTALLVRVARADNDYAEAERRMILQLLMERYALSEDDAIALRTEAEDLDSLPFPDYRLSGAPRDSGRGIVVRCSC